jgi:DNA-binding cell septation regulator SpoVG
MIEVTRVQIYKVESETNLKAFVQVSLGIINPDGDNHHLIKLTGLKLFEGPAGMNIAYPRNPSSKQNLCFAFPIDSDLRHRIADAAEDEYIKQEGI